MTEQEKENVKKAIRHFKCMRDDAKVVLNSGFGTHEGESSIAYDNRKMYAELAISAPEKQIPKKPTDTWENNIDRRRNHLCRWACPECGTFLGFENKHCTNCGIKIEWTFIA